MFVYINYHMAFSREEGGGGDLPRIFLHYRLLLVYSQVPRGACTCSNQC